jgi:hypothetical protein
MNAKPVIEAKIKHFKRTGNVKKLDIYERKLGMYLNPVSMYNRLVNASKPAPSVELTLWQRLLALITKYFVKRGDLNDK